MDASPLSDWLILVKKITKEKKLTQSSLADKAGISKSYLSEIFSGKKEPKFSIVISIFLALNIAPLIEFKNINNDDKAERDGISSE